MTLKVATAPFNHRRVVSNIVRQFHLYSSSCGDVYSVVSRRAPDVVWLLLLTVSECGRHAPHLQYAAAICAHLRAISRIGIFTKREEYGHRSFERPARASP